jgi:nitrate reductase NapE component
MPNTSKTRASTRWKVRRVLLFGMFPLLTLPFIFGYALGAWWLLTVLDGFPGGFFRLHPSLTVAAVVILASFLFIVTTQALWDKMRARF